MTSYFSVLVFKVYVSTGQSWMHLYPASSSGRQPEQCSYDSRSMPSHKLVCMWLHLHASSSCGHLASRHRRERVPPDSPFCMPEQLQEDGAMHADSVRRKRKTKMNKHKHRKRLKKMRHGAK